MLVPAVIGGALCLLGMITSLRGSARKLSELSRRKDDESRASVSSLQFQLLEAKKTLDHIQTREAETRVAGEEAIRESGATQGGIGSAKKGGEEPVTQKTGIGKFQDRA